jgi:hypothetical protein
MKRALKFSLPLMFYHREIFIFHHAYISECKSSYSCELPISSQRILTVREFKELSSIKLTTFTALPSVVFNFCGISPAASDFVSKHQRVGLTFGIIARICVK